LVDSLNKADTFLQPYRGRVVTLDRVNMVVITIAFILCLVASMVIGMQEHWGYVVIFIIAFFTIAFISHKLVKIRSNKYLRQAHFMLSILCRAENNRLYLQKNTYMKPGFLGKFIEFCIAEQDPDNSMAMLDWRYKHNQSNFSSLNKGQQEEDDRALALRLQEMEQEEDEEEDEEEAKRPQPPPTALSRQKMQNESSNFDQDDLYRGIMEKKKRKASAIQEEQKEEDDFISPDHYGMNQQDISTQQKKHSTKVKLPYMS